MANQNNDNAAVGMAFAVIVTAAVFLFALIFALAAFASAVFTIIALFAWDKPRTLFGETIYPHEARAFVYRGLLGMVLAPLFVIFCVALFKTPIIPEAWLYIIIGGYVGGSVGVEYLKAKEAEATGGNVTYIPPAPPAALPTPKETARPHPPREPFTFGTWDDEEPRR